MSVRSRWLFLAAIILLPMPMYLYYIGVSGILDYLLGDGLFAQDILYGSPREVMRVVLANWIASIPVAVGLFLLILLPGWFLLKQSPWQYSFIMLVAGALFGFYFLKGGLLSTVAVAIVFFLVAIITERVLRLAAG